MRDPKRRIIPLHGAMRRGWIQMIEPLNEQQIEKMLSELHGWTHGTDAIEKTLEFRSFKEAMGFVNRVADVAEDMDHHPDIEVNYSTVHLKISTHSVGGLTIKDFTLAKKVDGLTHAH